MTTALAATAHTHASQHASAVCNRMQTRSCIVFSRQSALRTCADCAKGRGLADSPQRCGQERSIRGLHPTLPPPQSQGWHHNAGADDGACLETLLEDMPVQPRGRIRQCCLLLAVRHRPDSRPLPKKTVRCLSPSVLLGVLMKLPTCSVALPQARHVCQGNLTRLTSS